MVLCLLSAVLLTAASTPLAVVKEGNTEVQQLAGRRDATEAQLAAVVDRFVDFGELSRRALGEAWGKLTPAQRKTFSSELRGLLRASYAHKALSQGRTQTLYGRESISGNEALVGTTVVINRDRSPVDYKLYREGASAPWRIYDVVTDGVSLLTVYQEQLARLLESKGFDGVVATLRAKRAQFERGAPGGP